MRKKKDMSKSKRLENLRKIENYEQPKERHMMRGVIICNWKYFISGWIRFLQAKYLPILNYIMIEFPKRRVQYQIAEARLKNAMIQHMITYEMFTWFLLENNIISEDDRNKLCYDFYNIITNIVNQQSLLARKQALHLLYCPRRKTCKAQLIIDKLEITI